MYFSYDELLDEPERCILEIQSVLGKLLGKEVGHTSLTPIEKEIIYIALSHNGFVQTQNVCSEIKLHRNTAYKYLRSMVNQGWFEPIGDQITTKYKLNEHKKHLFRI
jgi:predicted transcriptional regulator